MLYVLVADDHIQLVTSDNPTAESAFKSASEHAGERTRLRLYQLQADVCHSQDGPLHPESAAASPLSALEAQQLRDLLDRLHPPSK
jgi:hypothetical protein